MKIDADGRGDHAAKVVAVAVPFDPGTDAGYPGAEYERFVFVFKGLYKVFQFSEWGAQVGVHESDDVVVPDTGDF